MLSDVSVLPADLNDAAAIADLVNSAYRGDSGRQGWTTEANILGGSRTSAEIVSELIITPGTFVFKGLLSDRLVGCVELKSNDDGSAYIGMLTVNPFLQNSGIGARLLNHAELVAAEKGASFAKMTVIDIRQELIAWYERKGYQRTENRQKFEFTDDRFGIPLEDLYFLELVKPLTSVD
jgi:ribosomal protein S18 acetylase RimI-like enzyme